MNSHSWIHNLFSPRTPRTIRKPRAGRRLGVEALEDRTLLAADLYYQAVADTPLTLRLGANELQIVASTNPSTVFASELLANLTDGVLIEGNGFNVNLTIDATVPTVSGGIQFAGGSGTNTLAGPATDSTWHVTGAGSGDLGGVFFVQFTGVENLTGAAGDDDTFVFGPGGQVRGINGGSGGNDRLVFENGPDQVTFAPTGSQPGAFELGGAPFTYAGLEPYTFNLSGFANAANVVIVANPGAANDLSLTRFAPGLLRVSTDNSAESFVFRDPAQSLTIQMGGLFNNTLTLGATGAPLVLPGALTIGGGGLDDRVSVAGPVTVSHGNLVIEGETGRSEVTVNEPLTVLDGGLTIDDDPGFGQIVRFNAPVTVHGNVSILGTLLDDQVVLAGALTATGGLLIEAATGKSAVTLGPLTIGGGGLTIDGQLASEQTVRLTARPP